MSTFASYEIPAHASQHWSAVEQRDGLGSSKRGHGPTSIDSQSIYSERITGSSSYVGSSAQPTRTMSNMSKSTIPSVLFRDFDGVHVTPIEDEEEQDDICEVDETIRAIHRNEGIHGAVEEQPLSIESVESRPLLRDVEERLYHPPAVESPPSAYLLPLEGTVYYPAPVPVNLNMPQRLSRHALPSSQSQLQVQDSQLHTPQPTRPGRKSVIGTMGEQHDVLATKRAEKEPETPDPNLKKRRSLEALKKLPPQLRATMFFDHKPVVQNVPITHESAVHTLESFLDTGATVPATHFKSPSDMEKLRGPYESANSVAGRLPEDEYLDGFGGNNADPHTRSSSRLDMDIPDGRFVLDGSETGGDEADAAEVKDRAGKGMKRAMQSGDPYEEDDGSCSDDRMPAVVNGTMEHGEEEQYTSAPATLLAELVIRKKNLKDRSRTAATAFPQGMHSTLLELDAVAQIEKSRRRNVRPTLAWEDPDERNQDGEAHDEDVPLGVLFPERQSANNERLAVDDWDRPLGLLNQRVREDGEPLSHRRNRIKGIPQPRRPLYAMSSSYQEDEHSEHEDETLAQRTRRLRSRKALDEALGAEQDGRHVTGSGDWASELMSQFGGPKETAEMSVMNAASTRESSRNFISLGASGPQNGASSPAVSDEGETLGQRRRRLQAERSREVSGASQQLSDQTAPVERPQSSFSNLMHPAPTSAHRDFATARAPSYSGFPSLLGADAARQSSHQNNLRELNAGAAFAAGASTYNPSNWAIPRGSFAQGFGAVGTRNGNATGSTFYSPTGDTRFGGTTGPWINTQTGGGGVHGNESGGLSPVQRKQIENWRSHVES